jgi:hypothetical protein
LYTAVFSFISLSLLEELRFELLIGWIVGLQAQSSYPTAAGIERFLSRGRVRKLESIIHGKNLMIKKEREEHLVNEEGRFLAALVKARASSRRMIFNSIRTAILDIVNTYIRLSDLRLNLDVFW